MLSPIDDSILQSNPKFALLHANLTAKILNGNGSTKNHTAQKERDAVTEALKTARTRAARSHLLKDALNSMDLLPQTIQTSSTSTSSKLKPLAHSKQATPLPVELIELILLLSSHLQTSSTLPPTSLALLNSTPLWASLPTHLPQISALLSSHLQILALALARIHAPTTNASYLHRSIPKLSPAIQTQLSSISQNKTELAARRLSLVSKTTTLLSLHHLATTLSILLLEQTKHGLLSRHLKARVEYLFLTAQQVQHEAKEKRVKGERAVYTTEVKNALDEYVRNLRDGNERLRERKGQAERVLWGYGVGRDGEKERLMREIARAYRELQREIAEVQRDVVRLKGK